jgi:hypothetical protein
MYNTIRNAIVHTLRREYGPQFVNDYDYEINLVTSELNVRLKQAVRALEDEAVDIGYDRGDVRQVLIRVGLVEDARSTTPERPVPALSGGVVPQQAAVSTQAPPPAPEPQERVQQAPQRSLWQRIFGG